MIAFLIENLATIIVGLVLAAVVALVIVKMRKDKRAGKSSCGCKCAGCSNSSACHGGSKVSKVSEVK